MYIRFTVKLRQLPPLGVYCTVLVITGNLHSMLKQTHCKVSSQLFFPALSWRLLCLSNSLYVLERNLLCLQVSG